ncbi:MAG: hypothetical protein MUC68_17890 [Burkholderiaceae bacterium]|nr:hypothetical protein [Burkholderiaceae bacterium]
MTTSARPFLSQRLLHGLLHALIALLVAGCAVGTPPARSSDVDRREAPPARVGKVGLLSGQVTMTDLSSGEQQPASLNWPITSGQRLTTGPLARAEVRIGSLALRLDGDSDVDFARVDDEIVQIVVQRGSVALRARSREILPEIDLVTPRERIVLDDVGRYRIDVDRAAGITALTAFVGSARIATGRMTFNVRSGQRGEIGQMPGTGFTLVQPAADTFDDWVASRDRRDDSLASTRYVSPETTGVEVLDHYGSWRTVPDYGPVWFPASVPSGWAPYRHGRWAYVAPWGWTWIDEAPWGFAPFHYGRWALVGGAWCWVPGAWVARPVYAPALVAWYGAPGVSVSIGVGSVGWFPLGPREVYVPWYGYNRRYITNVNIGHVTNINYINVTPPPTYVHATPRTATFVPNDAVLRHEPIRRVPAALTDGIKRRVAEPVPGGDPMRGQPRGEVPVRAQPAPAMPPTAVPGADPRRIAPIAPPATVPGSKFNPPNASALPSAPVPPAVAPRGPDLVRPQPAPMPRPSDDMPGRKLPMPEAPAPRFNMPPAMRPPQADIRVAPPPRVEPPRAEPPAPRNDGPRGIKAPQREQ